LKNNSDKPVRIAIRESNAEVKSTKKSFRNDLEPAEKEEKVKEANDRIKDVTALKIPSGYSNIIKFFQHHIVELSFKSKSASSSKRRMICTANWMMLGNSTIKKIILNWKDPKNKRGYYWHQQRNSILVWDFLTNGFRTISLNNWEKVAVIPIADFLNRQRFFMFYREVLAKLSESELEKLSTLED